MARIIKGGFKMKPGQEIKTSAGRTVAKPTVLKDVDTGWVDLPSGGRMRLKFKQVEW
jgi:hypothetical protein